MTPPRARARPGRSTRARPTDDELLDAAVAVFAERGFAATTMTLIAEACDSTKPTLYAHFGDKNALYTRAVEREATACRETLFAAYSANAGAELAQQVRADTRALFDYAAARPDGFAVLLGPDFTPAAMAAREQLLADVSDNIAHRVHDYISQSTPTGRSTAGRSPRGPSGTEKQLAAMLVGVALSAARHALELRGAGRAGRLDEACELASLFSIAALTNLQ